MPKQPDAPQEKQNDPPEQSELTRKLGIFNKIKEGATRPKPPVSK
jgi:hypothetical protein